jgi:hypothetical protein
VGTEEGDDRFVTVLAFELHVLVGRVGLHHEMNIRSRMVAKVKRLIVTI